MNWIEVQALVNKYGKLTDRHVDIYLEILKLRKESICVKEEMMLLAIKIQTKSREYFESRRQYEL